MNAARRRALLLGLVLTTCSTWPALATTIAIPEGRIAAPRISVPGAEQPIRLDAVRIATEITGGFAYTQVEMTFFNPNPRVFEGELQFPLLDGQNVIGFALDVDGRMREASSVPKARGQEAFEEIARRGVDPGLLQVTQGNNFKLRVYPLFARGKRIVQVRYIESLAGRGGNHVFRLPVEYGADIRSFSVNIVARGAERSPAVVAGLPAGSGFQREGGDYVLSFERQDYTPKGLVEVAVAAGERPAAFVQPFDGNHYFVAEVRDRSWTTRRALPGEIGLIWDASLSGRERDRSREFALLDAYFKRARDARVWLTRVRDAAEPGEWHEVRDGNWDGLRLALQATVYDGGTNLGDFQPQHGLGEYLLFSDGISNFGGKPFPHAQVPVYAINASRKADPAALRHIAERSGGRYIDLVADSRSVAAGKLLNSASRIESVVAEGASSLILASRYSENGRFVIAGVLDEAAARVRLRVSTGGDPREVTFNVSRNSPSSSVAAKRWAYLRAGELEREFTVNRGELERVGMRFGIVTRETSLIVLEFARDYAQYDIAPPPELRAEVERLRPQFAQRRAQDEVQLLNRAAQLYAQRAQWWEREFPKGDKPAPALLDERRPPLSVRPDPREMLSRGMGAGASRDMAREPMRSEVQRRNMQAAPRMAEKAAGPASLAASEAADDRLALGELSMLHSWQPDAPYMERLRLADTGDLYRIYLDMRRDHESNAGFYLDVAQLLAERGLPDLSLRVLSNLAEIDLENRHLLRILGHRLMSAGKPELASAVFARVLELAPYEPQSHRDLALAYGAAGRTQKAADHLYEIARRTWHARFPGMQELAAAELAALVAGNEIDTSRMDTRLLRNLPLQLRVVASWDSDNTNIDLVVTDPNGDVAQPGRLTYQGGRHAYNFFGGYGPEEFALKQAKPGRYKVAVRHAGTRQQTLIAPTTVQIAITTGFGTSNERTRIVTRRLAPHQTLNVAEFDFSETAGASQAELKPVAAM